MNETGGETTQAGVLVVAEGEMGDIVFGKISIAVVTPFADSAVDASQAIDMQGFQSIVTHLAKNLSEVSSMYGMVGGIIVSGTTGEQHTMSIEERKSLYSSAVLIARQFNVAIAAGVAATTTSMAVDLAKHAVACGCQGIMLGLPPYCRICDEEILGYVIAVKSVVPDSMPILLYNNVTRNGYGPSNDLLAHMASSNLIWGVKHAPLQTDFTSQAYALQKLNPEIRLYTGSDKMCGDLLSADASLRFYGLTSIVGNIFPMEVASMVAKIAGLPPRKPSYVPNSDISSSSSSSSSSNSSCSNNNNNNSSSSNNSNNSSSSCNSDNITDNQPQILICSGKDMHKRISIVADAVLVGCSLPVGLKYALRLKGISGGLARLPVGNLSTDKKNEIEITLNSFT